jgi:hypothetical protein
VREGDDLWKIAEKYGLDAEEVFKMNPQVGGWHHAVGSTAAKHAEPASKAAEGIIHGTEVAGRGQPGLAAAGMCSGRAGRPPLVGLMQRPHACCACCPQITDHNMIHIGDIVMLPCDNPPSQCLLHSYCQLLPPGWLPPTPPARAAGTP